MFGEINIAFCRKRIKSARQVSMWEAVRGGT